MSALTEWQRDFARAFAAAIPLEPLPLRRFRVQIGSRAAPRLDFEVMAESAAEACMKADDLCAEGERVDVRPVPEAEWLAADLARNEDKASGALRRREDQRALQEQVQREGSWR